ncbi:MULTISPECIES: hypothetical protein [Phaeobacter]|uniref:hypothetical protein n=1 Tax=Phaeobacter TaxID=302485 RepID=UPI000591188C|nr:MULTISPECIES: hypothetical protein [Phaeobacter]AUQ89369.1 hypothetical protein PhaeoP24_00723 [Phaeobacter inhibens]KII12604.1 hypothetical protein OO25_17140 [Phaeobacter sp. S60]
MQTTATPLISDDLLNRFANPTAPEQLGEYDPEIRAMLAVALPEICSELLTWRQNAAERAAHAQTTRREMVLKKSRSIVRTPAQHSARTVERACETVMRFSPSAAERETASQVLAQTHRAA